MDKYSEIIEKIRNLRLDQDSMDTLQSKIEAAACNSEPAKGLSLFDLLFGWTNIVWLRRGLLAASVLLFVIFAIQQYIIINRIDSLENRMVSISWNPCGQRRAGDPGWGKDCQSQKNGSVPFWFWQLLNKPDN